MCVCASVLGLCVPAKKVNMAQSPDLVCGKVGEREDDNVWLDIRYVNNLEKEAEREGDANRHLADYNRERSIVTSSSSRNEKKIWLLESTVGNYSN